MSKTRYMLMQDSDQTTEDGVARVDVFSFSMNELRQNDILLTWTLSEDEVYRFDQFIRKQYGGLYPYLEITKWYNNLFEMDEDKIETEIKLLSKKDIDKFFREQLINLEKS